jgi:ribosome biogenesis protein BMS1
VKSLQNTKYSIDEKLEKSFISLFSRNANISSEAQNDAKDNHESVDHSHNLEPNESGEESDAEDLDGSESTDEDEAAQKDALVNGESDGSDEEYGAAAKQKVDPQDRMKEQVEFHGGRLRRKAMFGNDIDDKDLKVINVVTLKKPFLTRKGAIKKGKVILKKDYFKTIFRC